jgi:hypothetical protein
LQKYKIIKTFYSLLCIGACKIFSGDNLVITGLAVLKNIGQITNQILFLYMTAKPAKRLHRLKTN